MIPRVRIKRANVNESGGREPVPIRSHPCSSLVSCQDSWIAYWDQERKTLRKSPLRSPSAHWSTSEWGTDFINRKRPEFRAKNLAYASNYGDYIVKSICFTQSPSHCRLWETILFEHLQVFSNHHIDPYRSILIIRIPCVKKYACLWWAKRWSVQGHRKKPISVQASMSMACCWRFSFAVIWCRACLASSSCSSTKARLIAVAEWKRQKTFGSETFKRHSRDIQAWFVREHFPQRSRHLEALLVILEMCCPGIVMLFQLLAGVSNSHYSLVRLGPTSPRCRIWRRWSKRHRQNPQNPQPVPTSTDQ